MRLPFATRSNQLWLEKTLPPTTLVSLDFEKQIEKKLIPFIKKHNLQPANYRTLCAELVMHRASTVRTLLSSRSQKVDSR